MSTWTNRDTDAFWERHRPPVKADMLWWARQAAERVEEAKVLTVSDIDVLLADMRETRERHRRRDLTRRIIEQFV